MEQLHVWKDFWLERYEPVYAYLLSGDREVIAGKTFTRDRIVSTWLGSNPEVLRSPELGDALPCLPIKKLWVDPGIDIDINQAARTNLSPPHAFLLWRRVDGPDREVLTMRSSRLPFIKLNIYGALDFDSLKMLDVPDTQPLTRSIKVSFGQPPGWFSIFLRAPTPGDSFAAGSETQTRCLAAAQAPTACSFLQYRLEQFGRKAEFLFLCGAFGLILVLSVLVKNGIATANR